MMSKLIPLPIPNDPSLCGLALYSQVWHVDLTLPVRLSNAMDLYLGE